MSKLLEKISQTWWFSEGIVSQNKDIQKVDSSNRYHAMIHHQNADATVPASALMRGITPLDIRHFEYFQGVNASQTRALAISPWRQHFDDELRLRQNH